MANIVKAALVQAAVTQDANAVPLEQIKRELVDLHVGLVEKAAGQGAAVVCLQELFNSSYFGAEQDMRWYALAEPIPDGLTVTRMAETAKRLGVVLVAPIYEEEAPGIYYNTAAVIDADGTLLGKYRKTHITHCEPGFWEKFYFRPGNLGYPVFETAAGKVGVYICYDRHFPEPARCLGLAGAEIVFNPSATVAGLSENLWRLEQPAHAAANQYWLGAINRVGFEKPWEFGEFYGSSYFADPEGQIVAQASRDQTEVLVAELDLDRIREVRHKWQFYRDRRPETYDGIVLP
ncbi:MAG: nitrilase-related carbon-nitrogen hydrolase [Verrucomicrobiota bacterium]